MRLSLSIRSKRSVKQFFFYTKVLLFSLICAFTAYMALFVMDEMREWHWTLKIVAALFWFILYFMVVSGMRLTHLRNMQKYETHISSR